MANPGKLRVVHVDERRAIGTIENVCVLLWRGVPHENDIRRARLTTLELIKEHGRIGFLNILEENTAQPGPEVRKAALDMLADTKHGVMKWVFVAEGEGIRLALARAVMTALKVPLRLILPMDFSPTAKAGADLLASELENAGHGLISARHLLDAVNQLREELNQRTFSFRSAI